MKKLIAGIVCLLVLLISFQLSFFHSVAIFGYDGLVITDDKLSQNLANKPTSLANTSIHPSPVLASDTIFSQNGNFFFGDTSKTKFLKSYPTFINHAKALLVLDSASLLIDEAFQEHSVFANLLLSGGMAFQSGSNQRIDDRLYLFLKLANGFFINSLELKIATKLHTYSFAMNAIHNFLESSIQSYSPNNNTFLFSAIDDIDADSTIHIGSLSMSYAAFFKKLNAVEDASPSPLPSSTQQPPQQQPPLASPLPLALSLATPAPASSRASFAAPSSAPYLPPYIKPEVKVSPFLPIPYGFSSSLSIIDLDKHMRSAVSFFIYDGNDLVLRRSFPQSAQLTFDGLRPNYTYKVVATYEYLNDKQVKVSDTFMDVMVKTGGISQTSSLDLTASIHQVSFDSFSLQDLKITSPLDQDIVAFTQLLRIQVGNVSYDLKPNELANLKKGEAIPIEFPKLLASNTDYTVSMHAFDRFKNELQVNFSPLSIHTSKRLPDVVFHIVKKEIDNLDVRYSIKDVDQVHVQQGKFQLHSVKEDGSAGDVLMEMDEDKVNNQLLSFRGFAFFEAYILRYVGSVDIQDGKGLQHDVILKDYKFSNASLSQLGSINLTTKIPSYTPEDSVPKLLTPLQEGHDAYAYSILNDTQYRVTYAVDTNISSAKLLDMFDALTLQVYSKNEKGQKVVAVERSYQAGDVNFEAIKQRKEFSETYTSLTPDTQYIVEFQARYKKQPIGVATTINQFKTWKATPKASLKHLTMTSNTLHADIALQDRDAVNDAQNAMITLQTFHQEGTSDQDKLTNGRVVDVAHIDSNQPDAALVMKGLVPGTKYVLNYHISDAKWSKDSFPMKEEKLYLQSYVFTAQDVLDGSLAITQLTQDPKNDTQLQVGVKTTLKDSDTFGTGVYAVDFFDGDTKVEKFSYTDTYSPGTPVDTTKMLSMPKADTTYTAVLSIVAKNDERRVELARTQFNTRAPVNDIHTCNELYAINGKSERYKVVNDLNCSAAANRQSIASFAGELDFDGHEFKFSYGGNVVKLFDRLGKGGIIKNLHFNLVENDIRGEKGIVRYNEGTISNLYLRTVASKKGIFATWGSAQIATENEGVIDTFVVDVKEGESLLGEYNISMVSVKNGGIIRNGYFSPFLFDISPGSLSRNWRKNGTVAVENKIGGRIENIYSLATLQGRAQYNAPPESAILVGYNKGTVKNLYTTAVPRQHEASTGSAVGANYGQASDVYYIDNRVRNNTANERITFNQLHSVSFQERVLNSDHKFDVNRFVYNGYYPHIKFDNAKMPQQPLRSIQTIEKNDKVEYIDYKVSTPPTDPTTFDYHGVVSITVRNPYQYKITGMTFNNLDATITGQTNDVKNSESAVTVRVHVPKDGEYVDQHVVRSITYEDAVGTSKTIEYPEEASRYIVNMSFYKQVKSIDDWQAIDRAPSWNYFVVNDIDFANVPDAGVLEVPITGSIDGNMRTLSKITTTKKGVLAGGLGNNGVLKNLNFKDVKISVSAQMSGLISQTRPGSVVDNVHGDNIENKDSWDQAGLLVGSAQGNISNSSIQNSKIVTQLKYIGGLVGRLQSNAIVSNSFVQDVTIQVDDKLGDQSHSIGGLIGDARDATIQNVYAVTTIKAPKASYVGGLIGSMPSGSTNINSVYAKSEITAGNTAGGLIGRSAQRGQQTGESTYESKEINGFFTGNINVATKANSDFTIGEATYVKEKPTKMFANTSSLLKGVGPAAGISIADEDFTKQATYTTTIGMQNGFSYNSDSTKALLPKLLKKEGRELLPKQKDNLLEQKDFYVKSVRITKESEYAQTGTLTAEIYNEANRTISNVNFLDDMMSGATGTTSYNSETKITTYSATVTPKYFVDTYIFKDVTYQGADGVLKDFVLDTEVNTKFYRNISSVETWPTNIPAKYYENYQLKEDIDFTGKVNDLNAFRKYFNNNVNDVVGNEKTIKNIDAKTLSLVAGSDAIFLDVRGTFANVNFHTIKMKYDFTNNDHGAGIFIRNGGKISNVKVDTMELDGSGGNGGREFGMIGYNAGILDTIEMKNSKVTVHNGGTHSVGLLVGNSYENSKLSNITIKQGSVETKSNGGQYIGGVIGKYTSGTQVLDGMNVDTVSVKALNNKFVGGVFGAIQGGTGNLKISNYNLKKITMDVGGEDNKGGIAGQNTRALTLAQVVAEDFTITGKQSGTVGGYIGHNGESLLKIEGSTMKKLTITSTRVNDTNLGGVIGMSYGVINVNGFTGTDISINATTVSKRIGGIVGDQRQNINLDGVELTKVTIKGRATAGGLIGRFYGGDGGTQATITNSYVKELDMVISVDLAGGFIGWVDGAANNVAARIENSGVEVQTIKGTKNGIGGMLGGIFSSERANITITKSYVKGLEASKGVIEGSEAAGGLVGDIAGIKSGVNNSLTVKDVYVFADVKATAGSAGLVAGKSTAVNVNGLIAMGKAEATAKAGGLIGEVKNTNDAVTVTSALMLADTKASNATDSNQLIGNSSSATGTTYDKVFMYMGNKINEQNASNSASSYENITGVSMIPYTDLIDAETFSSKLQLNANWEASNVKTNIAPQLANMKYQQDLEMTTNKNVESETVAVVRSLARNILTAKAPRKEMHMQAYTVDVNKVNLEFDSIDKEGTIELIQDGKTISKYAMDTFVYTLTYDFKEPFDVVVTSANEQMKHTVDPNAIRRDAYVDDTGYAYTSNDGITLEHGFLKGKFVNIYKGKAMKDNGVMYDLASKQSIGKVVNNLGRDTHVEALYTFTLDGQTIQTFHGFSTIGQTTRPGNMYVKNEQLVYFDATTAMVKDSVLVDKVNGKEIETILTTEGTLKNLKDPLPLPENFVNEGIAYVTSSMLNERGILIVSYKDGAKLLYDYKMNKVLYDEEAPLEKTDFVTFLKKNLSLNFLRTSPSLSDKYEEVKKTAENLMQAQGFGEVLEKSIEQTPTKQGATANKEDLTNKEEQTPENKVVERVHTASKVVQPKLLTVYNPEKKEYDMYNAQDLLNPEVKEVQDIKEMAVKNPELMRMLHAQVETVKQGNLSKYAMIVFVITLISGCLWYIIRQRKVVREHKQ